jgi:hypothetical protein
MHIITTIYCTDLKLNKRNAHDSADDGLQLATNELEDSTREFLSVYQGENRIGSGDQNT